MKKIGRQLTIILLAFLSLVMIFSAVSAFSFAGYADESDPAPQVETYETSWCKLEYSDGHITVLLNAGVTDYADFAGSDLIEVKNFLYKALTDTLTESILGSSSAEAVSYAAVAYADLDADTVVPEDIDIGRLESYITERLSDPAELGKYLDGGYDALVKVAVSKLVTDYGYEYGQVENKLVSVVDTVIESVYGEDEALQAQAKDRNALNVGSIVTEVQEAEGGLTLTVGDIQNALEKLSVNGITVFEGSTVNVSGLKKFLQSLPKPGEIAGLSDEDMRFDFDAALSTAYGDAQLTLTVGFYGDCSKIRALAQIVADHVDVAVADGTVSVSVRAPEALSSVLLKLTQTDRISDSVKNSVFSLFGKTGYDLMDKIESISYEELLNLLKSVDYKGVFANVLNADLINGYLGRYADVFGLTDAKIDGFIDKIFSYFRNKDFASMSVESVKEFLSDYVDLSSFDNDRLEAAAEKLLDILAKIDFDKYDAALIREFLDPDSAYTNESVYNLIDKFSGFDEYYDSVINYAERLFNALPESVKTHSILDIYRGAGALSFSGAVNIDLETVFEKLGNGLSRLGFGQVGIFDKLIALFEETAYSVDLSVDLSLRSIYSVSYNVNGEEVRAGLLPVGAELALFAGVTEVDGEPVTAWADENGVEYTVMPAADVALYAVTETVKDFTVETSVEGQIEKVYDGEPATVSVIVTGPVGATYTYQWVKDGAVLEGETSSSLTVQNVADSGEYICRVTSVYGDTVETEAVTVAITRKPIDVSAYEWNYTEAFVYDGEAHAVALKSVDDKLLVDYAGNTATDAGRYTATATLSVSDANYMIAGESTLTLSWEIKPATIEVSGYAWNYTEGEPFEYSGEAFTVSLKSVNEKLAVAYTGNTATDVGSYAATATLTVKEEYADNYVIGGEATLTLSWTIEPKTIDVSLIEWDYEGRKPLVYSGAEYTVELKNLPAEVKLVKYEGNTGTNAGQYNAVATLEAINGNYALSSGTLSLDWVIEAKVIDFTGAMWDYTAAFEYDGNEKTVALKNVPALPEGLSLVYEGNTATDAGSYTATVSLNGNNDNNYTIANLPTALSWKIDAAVVDASAFAWNYEDSFYYDGTAKKVELVGLPDYIEVTYTDNEKTEVGAYTAKAALTCSNSNYALIGTVADCEWQIVLAVWDCDVVIVIDNTGAAVGYSFKVQRIDDLGSARLRQITVAGERAALGVAYNIAFVGADGKEIEIEGDFTVKILVPENIRNNTLRLAYIAENGDVTALDYTIDSEGYAVFNTTHLSTYAILDIKDVSRGDMIWLWILIGEIAVVIVIILVCKIVVLTKDKKAKRAAESEAAEGAEESEEGKEEPSAEEEEPESEDEE